MIATEEKFNKEELEFLLRMCERGVILANMNVLEAPEDLPKMKTLITKLRELYDHLRP